MKKSIRIGLKIDTFLQGTALLGIVGSAIGSLFYYELVFMIIALSLIAFLGILQLSSALIFGRILKDLERRGMYLLAVIGFFWTHFLIAILDFHMVPSLTSNLVTALSTISVSTLAIRYFCITVQDMILCNSSGINQKNFTHILNHAS